MAVDRFTSASWARDPAGTREERNVLPGSAVDSKSVDRISCVRQNDVMEFAGFSWTAGSRRHRVSRARVQYVVAQAGLYFVRAPTPPERPDEALLFLGDDEDGMPIEVVGVEFADGRLRVIHAMRMRTSYGDLYEEARRWRQ